MGGEGSSGMVDLDHWTSGTWPKKSCAFWAALPEEEDDNDPRFGELSFPLSALDVPFSANPKPELNSVNPKNSSSGQSGMLPPKSAALAAVTATRGLFFGGALITSGSAGLIAGVALPNCSSMTDQSGKFPVMPTSEPAAQSMSPSL